MQTDGPTNLIIDIVARLRTGFPRNRYQKLVALKDLYLRHSVHNDSAAHRAPCVMDREFERSGNAVDRCRRLLRRSGTSETKPAPLMHVPSSLYVHNQKCNIAHPKLRSSWRRRALLFVVVDC
jgi:hypothetical protein